MRTLKTLSALCKLIWRHWTSKMRTRCMLSSACVCKIMPVISIILYSLYGLCIFSLPKFSCADHENVYSHRIMFYHHHQIKDDLGWSHCVFTMFLNVNSISQMIQFKENAYCSHFCKPTCMNQSVYIYIYIYIYVCVCVYVCVRECACACVFKYRTHSMTAAGGCYLWHFS